MSSNTQHHGNDFDRQLQAHYQLALAHVSPQTRLRLHPRQSTAPRQHWADSHLKLAALAIAADAVGMVFNTQTLFDSSRTTQTSVAADSNVSLNTVLDEDPAFLAWLGGSENDWIASQ